MKISQLIIPGLLLTFALWTGGCAVPGSYTEMGDELSGKDGELSAEMKKALEEKRRMEEEGLGEELLEEKNGKKRILPDILKDDPELIKLAEETGTLYTIYFGYDSYSIGPGFLETIKKDAHWMRVNPDVSIILEGHADERGGNEYNLALSQRRAQSIEKFLGDYGVNKRKLTILSYGEEKPANEEHTEAAWRENRRVEVKILE